MKTNENTVVYKDDNNIIVMVDDEFMSDYYRIHHQECVAVRERDFGFGLFITENELRAYGPDPEHVKMFETYLNYMSIKIQMALSNLNNISEAVDIMTYIIVDMAQCTIEACRTILNDNKEMETLKNQKGQNNVGM